MRRPVAGAVRGPGLAPARPAPARAALVAAAVLAGWSGAGCAGNAPQDGDVPAAAAPDTVMGQVRQVGSTPFTRTVVASDAASVSVSGPLEAELTRLVGARVRAMGALGAGEGPGPTLVVRRYDVLSVDGERPRVGVLRHEPAAGYRLEAEDGDAIPLRSVPPRLGGKVGAKVWVVLDDAGGVLRYGVLREP